MNDFTKIYNISILKQIFTNMKNSELLYAYQ